VTAASHYAVMSAEAALLAGAAATVMLAMTLIGAASASRRNRAPRQIIAQIALAAVTVASGAAGTLSTPLVLIIIVASAYAAQLALSDGVGLQPANPSPSTKAIAAAS
jgi:hypothetical protein